MELKEAISNATEKYKSMAQEIKQRSVSYSELAELTAIFEELAANLNLHGEKRIEAEIDFIEQYINGNDNPVIRIL